MFLKDTKKKSLFIVFSFLCLFGFGVSSVKADSVYDNILASSSPVSYNQFTKIIVDYSASGSPVGYHYSVNTFPVFDLLVMMFAFFLLFFIARITSKRLH